MSRNKVCVTLLAAGGGFSCDLSIDLCDLSVYAGL